jgi:hypothetical protein
MLDIKRRGGITSFCITPALKYWIKVLRIFADMRDAETAHTGCM